MNTVGLSITMLLHRTRAGADIAQVARETPDSRQPPPGTLGWALLPQSQGQKSITNLPGDPWALFPCWCCTLPTLGQVPPLTIQGCRSVLCLVPLTAAPPAWQYPPAAHPITHWAFLALGTHLPVWGAWAQHVLPGAGGGLVIGAVIAMSNDTLSWLPLARP